MIVTMTRATLHHTLHEHSPRFFPTLNKPLDLSLLNVSPQRSVHQRHSPYDNLLRLALNLTLTLILSITHPRYLLKIVSLAPRWPSPCSCLSKRAITLHLHHRHRRHRRIQTIILPRHSSLLAVAVSIR